MKYFDTYEAVLTDKIQCISAFHFCSQMGAPMRYVYFLLNQVWLPALSHLLKNRPIHAYTRATARGPLLLI